MPITLAWGERNKLEILSQAGISMANPCKGPSAFSRFCYSHFFSLLDWTPSFYITSDMTVRFPNQAVIPHTQWEGGEDVQNMSSFRLRR